MVVRKTVKQQITEAVLLEIPKNLTNDHNKTIDELVFDWWFTGRQGGLRLTDSGAAAFQLAKIEFFDFKLQQEGQSWYSFLLEVNKKIKCPFYLGVNKTVKPNIIYIRFYDSKIAMMLNLYGSLKDYLDSIKSE